jgi:hypothetical protein
MAGNCNYLAVHRKIGSVVDERVQGDPEHIFSVFGWVRRRAGRRLRGHRGTGRVVCSSAGRPVVDFEENVAGRRAVTRGKECCGVGINDVFEEPNEVFFAVEGDTVNCSEVSHGGVQEACCDDGRGFGDWHACAAKKRRDVDGEGAEHVRDGRDWVVGVSLCNADCDDFTFEGLHLSTVRARVLPCVLHSSGFVRWMFLCACHVCMHVLHLKWAAAWEQVPLARASGLRGWQTTPAQRRMKAKGGWRCSERRTWRGGGGRPRLEGCEEVRVQVQ